MAEQKTDAEANTIVYGNTYVNKSTVVSQVPYYITFKNSVGGGANDTIKVPIEEERFSYNQFVRDVVPLYGVTNINCEYDGFEAKWSYAIMYPTGADTIAKDDTITFPTGTVFNGTTGAVRPGYWMNHSSGEVFLVTKVEYDVPTDSTILHVRRGLFGTNKGTADDFKAGRLYTIFSMIEVHPWPTTESGGWAAGVGHIWCNPMPRPSKQPYYKFI